MNNKTKNWKKLQKNILSKNIFVLRSRIISAIRSYFDTNNFLEVETPLVVKHPGTEPYLDLFQTDFITKDHIAQKAFLITSPELDMKKLLSAGFEKVYQITKSFRNGEIGGKFHNPEFTMIEWYRTGTDYFGIMDDTENLIRSLFSVVNIESQLTYQDMSIDVSCPWERKTVQEVFLEFCSIDLNNYRDLELFSSWARQRGHHISEKFSWDDVFFQVFVHEIEPHLGKERPLFLYKYPATQAALCEICKDDNFWAERFELYIGGIELCNAFTELIDSDEAEKRAKEDMAQRKSFGKPLYKYDTDFIEALSSLPPCGGIALGVDRLVMLLLNQKQIQDVLFFPYEDL